MTIKKNGLKLLRSDERLKDPIRLPKVIVPIEEQFFGIYKKNMKEMVASLTVKMVDQLK